MRLLMVSQDFPPDTGGIQTYSAAHAEHLASRCDWFGVVAPDSEGAYQLDQEFPYPVFRVSCRNELLLFPLLFRLPGLMAQYGVDTVFHAQWQTVGASVLARRRGWKGSIQCAAHLRELLFNPYEKIPLVNRLFVRYRRYLLRCVDHFYPVSSYTRDQLIEEGVDTERLTIVPNGTDPERFFPGGSDEMRRKLGLAGRRVMITITRLVPRKGIDLVIRTLPELLKDIPDLRYLVVGEGDDRGRLERLVDQLGLQKSVHFIGRIPHERVRDYYQLADLFVMPSQTIEPDVEGAGIVFLEANACGLPVIGSDSGGIPSVIQDEETGFIVPEGDLDILKQRIRQLLTQPDLSSKMGENGRVYVLNTGNWAFRSGELFTQMQAVSGN